MVAQPVHSSYVMVLGPCSAETVPMVKAAADMAGQTVLAEPRLDDAAPWMEDAKGRPTAIIIDLARPDATGLAIAVRSRFSLAAVPIIGVCAELSDLLFEEAFASGVDDCCLQDPRLLGRQLQAVDGAQLVRVERRSQGVVIADPDRQARLIMGRVFHNAGYEVAFAADSQEALGRSLDEAVQIVVCSAAVETEGIEGEPLSRRAPRAGSRAAWIISTPPKEIPAMLRRIGVPDGSKVTVHDAFSAPDTLLFVANELMGRPGQEARTSERLLYGTTVRLRRAGQAVGSTGYSYNLSAGGMYVRTLRPPDRGSDLWLELMPPRSDRLVHLEAEVVWARSFGPGQGATVPSGFGVQISGATATDAERYGQSYELLLAERVALRESTMPAAERSPNRS